MTTMHAANDINAPKPGNAPAVAPATPIQANRVTFPVPRSISFATLGLSLLAALSTGAMCVLAMRANQPYYLLMGMELCIGLAAALGVLFARGFFREGPGMALACVSGTIFVASVLGYLSVPNAQMTMSSGGTLALKPFLMGRVLLASLLGLAAAWIVLSRDPQSRSYILRAILTGIPLGAIAFVGLKGRSWLSGGGAGVPAWVGWIGAIVLACVGLALFCACVHCTIRAFEMGRRAVDARS
jgi:hypothetical protein